jgi:hypothetical protein
LNGTGEPWVAQVPMDGFHLADVELDRLGLRDRAELVVPEAVLCVPYDAGSR